MNFMQFFKIFNINFEKLDGICSLNFAVDEFSGLFLHLALFSIIYSRSA